MALVIEFYVPEKFRYRRRRSPEEGRGKVLQFVAGVHGKYIWLPSGALWPMRQAAPPPDSAPKRIAKQR